MRRPSLDELARIEESDARLAKEHIAELRHALDAFLPEGECYMLPNGSCVGKGCPHDIRKR